MHRIAPPSVLLAGILLAPAALGQPVISNAWVRAMPPTQSMTAGYLALDNTGDSAITITGATSDASPRVEIHTTVTRDGMQRMQPVDAIEVKAGGRVELAPGGYHLMLREMPSMPVEGDSIELCLELASGNPVCTVAVVRRGAPDANSHHDH